jgi:hypothetical protein
MRRLAAVSVLRISSPRTVRNDSNNRDSTAQGSWENMNMPATSRPVSHEQKKIEKLLLKLAKIKPISAKPAPIADGQFTRRTA